MKFKFIQIREIKIRLERFFEKLYLYWKFSRRKFGESSQFFLSLAVKDEWNEIDGSPSFHILKRTLELAPITQKILNQFFSIN